MSSVSVSTRKSISLGAWLYLAAAVAGAWPVLENLVATVRYFGDVVGPLQDGLNIGNFLRLVGLFRHLLEPMLLLAGLVLGFTKAPKRLRATPGFLFPAGFVFVLTSNLVGIVLAVGMTSEHLISVWGWLVGDVPHAITYLLAVILTAAAGFLTIRERVPAAAGAAGSVAAPVAGRTPVGFDPQTGRPIYGYDVNTGQPIF